MARQPWEIGKCWACRTTWRVKFVHPHRTDYGVAQVYICDRCLKVWDELAAAQLSPTRP